MVEFLDRPQVSKTPLKYNSKIHTILSPECRACDPSNLVGDFLDLMCTTLVRPWRLLSIFENHLSCSQHRLVVLDTQRYSFELRGR